ncbi:MULTISPECIES: asparaginase [unclassified Actinomyces]|uniref:asparaginase n=1 Tax=unclassified Actinomyces TaxID=2609248 RepID=UPI001373B7A0|nr:MULTISPECIES: asparaginase [unclassified Actinomyces]NDR53159.1 asparaginase [Actinomyces sp. 565]QHO90337.1 L-asparaginase 1 [Actinomyces sp. 432]
MHIHFTYAGGTIGMIDSPRGLQPGADLGGWLPRLIPGFTETVCTRPPTIPPSPQSPAPGTSSAPGATYSLTTLQPLLDSAETTPYTWQQVIDDVQRHAGCADAFVVLHGTDTMAYTASALSYALIDLEQPVVVTGSQLPLGATDSDAAANLTGAVYALTQGAPRGVHLFFGGRLLAGNRATKTSTWSLQGFESPNTPPLAVAGAPWHWSPRAPRTGVGWSAPLPYTAHDVPVIDMAPGLSSARLKAALTPAPVAVIVRAFGVGNLPAAADGPVNVLAQAVRDGVTVVIASQCPQGEVALGRYAAGAGAAQAGAVGSGDMTLEAAYAKLQFLASQGLRGAELGKWMGRDLAGELTAPATRH